MHPSETFLMRLSGENSAFCDDEKSLHFGTQLGYAGTALFILSAAERSVFINTIKVTSEVLTRITAHFPLTPYSHSTTSAAGKPGFCTSKFNWSHMSWGSICFKIWGVVSDTNVRNKKEMVTSSSHSFLGKDVQKLKHDESHAVLSTTGSNIHY